MGAAREEGHMRKDLMLVSVIVLLFGLLPPAWAGDRQ
jgi:hypothetical protein